MYQDQTIHVLILYFKYKLFSWDVCRLILITKDVRLRQMYIYTRLTLNGK